MTFTIVLKWEKRVIHYPEVTLIYCIVLLLPPALVTVRLTEKSPAVPYV